MAGGALGTTLSLLLLASAVQGVFKVTHLPRMEALVGQNVSLPCAANDTDAKLVSIEWSLRGTKLVVYTPSMGTHHFWSNLTISIIYNEAKNPIGTYLQLSEARAQDTGVYTCDIATFPYGSARAQTELWIKDFKVTCDVDGVEVRKGENVTIRCTASSTGARYVWTKGKEIVSEGASLELRGVTEDQGGVYTLTVSADEATLRKEIIITVQTTTTTTTRQPGTVTASPWTTAESLSTPSDRNLTPSATAITYLATPTANSTFFESDNTTNEGPSPSNATVTPAASSTLGGANASTTSWTANSSTTPTIGTGDNLTDGVPGRSGATAMWGTSGAATGNGSLPHTDEPRPGIMGNGTSQTPTVGLEITSTDNADGRARLVFIIVPVLLLIVLAAVLYRRQIIKKRMDLPPPFKPPPPPVKYTAARHWEDQSFPVSRCNSTIV